MSEPKVARLSSPSLGNAESVRVGHDAESCCCLKIHGSAVESHGAPRKSTLRCQSTAALAHAGDYVYCFDHGWRL